MESNLTLEIVKHIFSSLGLINEYAVSKSILEKDFLLPERMQIVFDEKEYSNKVRGVKILMPSNNYLTVLASKGKYDSGITDHIIIVQLNDSPAYGCSLTLCDGEEPLAKVCYAFEEIWVECNTTQKAKLLLGMEQVKEVGFGWKQATDYKDKYNLLVSFARHIAELDSDEG